MNPRGDVEFDLDLAGADDDARSLAPRGRVPGALGGSARLAPVLGWGCVAAVLAAVGIALVPTPPVPTEYLVPDLSRPPAPVWESGPRDLDVMGYGSRLTADALVTWGPGGLAAFELADGARRWRVEDHVLTCGIGGEDLVACVVGSALGSQDREVVTVDVATGSATRRDGEQVVAVETLSTGRARTVELRLDRVGAATVESWDEQGRSVWSVLIPRPRSVPATLWSNGAIVVVAGRDTLVLDAADGGWLDPARLQTGNGGEVWAAVGTGSGVVVHAPDGRDLGVLPRGALLPVLDGEPGAPPHVVLDRRGVAVVDEFGTVLWRDERTWDEILRVDDVLVRVESDGSLTAFDARDGRRLWELQPGLGWSARWTDGALVAATTPSRHGSRLVAIDPVTGGEEWTLDLDGGWVSDISPDGYVLVEMRESFAIWRLP